MSFAFPAGFWLALLAAPLVLLYFLKLRRHSVSVSSTLLWSRVIEDRRANAPWERLRRHLLLLLQLLLLALLVLAFAGPHRRGTVTLAADTVLVLDGSASMLAKGEDGERRFDLARAQALRIAESADSGRRVALVLAGPQPAVLSPLSGDAAVLRRALAAAEPAQAPADLRAALELAGTLVRGRPGSEVVLFTDGAFEAGPPLLDLLAGVRPVLVGEPAPNAGIASVSLRRRPGAAGTQEVFAGLVAEGGRARPATLLIEARAGDGEWSPVAEEELVLEPGRRLGRVFEVEALPDTELRLSLASEGEDALALDDEALLVVPPPPEVKVLLVSRSPWLASRALSSIDGVTVFVAEGLPEAPESFDLVVLDGVVPEVLPAAPLLVFGAAPAESPGPLARRGTIAQPSVVRWDRRHPVLRHVAMDSVILESAWRVEPPEEAAVLVESAEGPLAATWNGPGGPVLHFAFDLLRSDLPLRVAFPVLLQDSVDWLTSRNAAAAVLAAGRPAELRLGETAGPVLWREPDGHERRLEARSGTVRVPAPERVGLNELRWTPATPPGSPERVQRLPVALLSPGESDLSPRLDLSAVEERAEAGGGSPERVPGRHFLWPWLVALALAAALAEWTVHHRRPA